MKSVNSKRESANKPAGKPGGKTGRLAGWWPGRHPRLALIALAVAAGAAAWGGWRYFSHPRIKIEGIRHVVLVSIDTCRADRLSCYGYKRPSTPNIDALAREGVLFRNALTPVPETTPAHSSMLTGTYPPTHGVRINGGEPLADSNVTLAEILRKAGYRTAAFVSGHTLDPRFGLNQGFDTYDCQYTRKNMRWQEPGERTAEETNRSALAWLEKNARKDAGEKPFFLFLHYFDPHFPYVPPAPYSSDFADDLYAGEIAYVDHHIGQVLDRLRALGAYDNTLVIITGDHGEGLGEHGENTHGFCMYQSTLHVPLVIRAPQAGPGRRVEENVSLVDIVPTVLDLVALKSPPPVQGVSLRGALEGGAVPDRKQPIYCESLLAASYGCTPLNGVVEGPWKYIRAPRQELYDLKGDSAERKNLVEKEPAVARRLRGRLEAMLQEMESPATQRGPSPIDPEVLKRLQGLGYMSGGEAPPTSAFDPALEDPKDFLPTFGRLQHAFQLCLSGDKEEAQRECFDMLKGRPKLMRARLLLFQIALDSHRTADAKRHAADIMALRADLKDSVKRLPDVALDSAQTTLSLIALGKALMAEGKAQEALAEFENALQIDSKSREAQYLLAQALESMGQREEAIAHYRKVLEIDPRFARACNNLGVALREQGKVDEAMAHFRKALDIDPEYADAHYNVGLFLQQTGKLPEAIGQYEHALRIKPDYAEAHCNLAVALQQTLNLPEAIGHYTQALRIKPDFVLALNNLAWIRATHDDPKLRNGGEAVRLAEHGCQINGRRQWGLLDTLAAAYAEAGRFPDAVATAEEALTLARAGSQPAAAAEIQARLALYRAGQPYREASRNTPPPTSRPGWVAPDCRFSYLGFRVAFGSSTHWAASILSRSTTAPVAAAGHVHAVIEAPPVATTPDCAGTADVNGAGAVWPKLAFTMP